MQHKIHYCYSNPFSLAVAASGNVGIILQSGLVVVVVVWVYLSKDRTVGTKYAPTLPVQIHFRRTDLYIF